MADLLLSGLRIAVTRPREQAEPLASALERLGAEVSIVPLIRIDPVSDVDALEASTRGRHRYDWLVVTSTNGAAALAGRPGLLRVARTARIAAVGPATAVALQQLGLEPDFVPETYAADRIAAGLGPLTDVRILLAQADIADSALAEELREGGAVVQPIRTHRTVAIEPSEAEVEALRSADAVILMSGSAARSLASAGGAGGSTVVCIGPKTTSAAREVGLRVGLVADEATADGIIRALVEHFAKST